MLFPGPFLHKNQLFEPRQTCLTYHLFFPAYFHLPVPSIIHSHSILSVYYINVETAYLASGSWMRMSLSNIRVYRIFTVFCKLQSDSLAITFASEIITEVRKAHWKTNKYKFFIIEDKTLLDMQQLMQTHHHNGFSSAGATTPQ